MLKVARIRQEHLRTVIKFNSVEVTRRNGKYSSYVLLNALEEGNLSKEIYSPGLCYFQMGASDQCLFIFPRGPQLRMSACPPLKVKQCSTCRP